MSAYINRQDPPPFKTLGIIWLACMLALAIGMASCTNDGQGLSYQDNYNTTLPAQDTCDTPVLITEPPFVTGYMEITEDLVTPLNIVTGPYSYLIASDETDEIDTKLDSLYHIWHHEFTYHSVESANDYRIFSTIVDGTNDKSIFHLKTYVEYNGLRHYFGWSIQGFIFAGSRDEAQYKEDALNYPSVRAFNYRGTEWDSIQYDKMDYILLGYCKEGRDWADFRWGIHSHEVIQQFIDAGWGTVLSSNGPQVFNRSHQEAAGTGLTMDARGQRVDEAWILWWLERGYQVIVDAPGCD